MPQYFHYRSPQTQFDGILKHERCRHILRNGHRCKRNVILGLPFCFQHRSKIKVATSTIPHAGLGLFAHNGTDNDAVVFQKKDEIAPYYGELVTPAIREERYGTMTAPYGLELTRQEAMDGALKRGLGTLVNHKPNREANTRFSVKRNKKEVNLVATKTIRNRKELFVNYGRQYKWNEPGVIYSTNKAKYKV